jgi:NADH:ubiquinone oxidoreductase subunit E
LEKDKGWNLTTEEPKKQPVTWVYVCVNRRPGAEPSCGERGSDALVPAIEARCRSEGMAVEVAGVPCFGKCAHGPNLRIGGGRFFHGVRADDLDDVIVGIADQSDDA